MAVTVATTVMQALATVLGDGENVVLSAAELEQLVIARCRQESNFPLQRRMANVWGYWGPLALYGPTVSSPGFDEEAGASYTLSLAGALRGSSVTLKKTAGTDTRDPITITGCQVDFAGCVEDMLMFVADHRATEYDQAINGHSVSPQTARAELIRQAEIWRGIRAV